MRYGIGIDLAKRRHSAAVVAPGGERLLAGFEFANDGEGFASLLARLSEVGATCGESGVCLEATGHYGRNLIAFLEAHGYAVFEVNPLLTSSWRRAMSVRKVKNDAVDAEALAMWLLAGNPTRRRRSKSETDDLRSLARSRTSLSHIVGDCKRRAHAIVDVVFPEFHGFFSDDFCKAGRAVLGRWGSAAGVARARVDSVGRVMREASGGRFGREDAVRLKALARKSVGHSSAPLEFQLRQLMAQMEFTQGQMAELDAELERMLEGSPITTIPGIGTVCGAIVLGEIGDVSRFSSASQIVAFAGCDPSVFESGELEGARHLSKRGSPYLRWGLWLAANRARMSDPVLREYYLKKRSEGKCHKVALSAVVRKLCAIVFAVLRDGKPYVCPTA